MLIDQSTRKTGTTRMISMMTSAMQEASRPSTAIMTKIRPRKILGPQPESRLRRPAPPSLRALQSVPDGRNAIIVLAVQSHPRTTTASRSPVRGQASLIRPSRFATSSWPTPRTNKGYIIPRFFFHLGRDKCEKYAAKIDEFVEGSPPSPSEANGIRSGICLSNISNQANQDSATVENIIHKTEGTGLHCAHD